MPNIHKALGLHEIEVSTKAAPDWHPDVLSAHQEDLIEVVDGEVQQNAGSVAYGKAHDALAGIYSWHVDVTEAEQQFAKLGHAKAQFTGRKQPEYFVGPNKKVAHGGEKDVYAAAGDAMTNVLNRVQNYTKELYTFRDKVSGAIAKEMDSPDLKTPFGIAVAQTTWALLRDMKDGTNQNQKVPASAMRANFLQKAIEAGDRLTVMGILNAPAYLSGLNADQVEVYRNHAANTWAPKASRQLRAINAIIDKVDRASVSVLGRYQELSKTVGVVSEREKAANRALEQLKKRPANWGTSPGPLAKGNT